MSIIRRSADLEVIVLRIFEDLYRFGGDAYIISPWIHNFSFTEAILTGFQIQIFGSEPSLHTILQRCSESQLAKSFSIISHNFGVKPTFFPRHLRNQLQHFGIDSDDLELVMENKMEKLFELYQALFKEYREYSKFNDPWLSTYFRHFKHFIDYVSTPETYQKVIGDIVQGSGQANVNVNYLNDLRKFLEVGNVKIGLHNNFHAKIFLAASSCVTGSSNWTFSGFCKNDEINLFFSEIDSSAELKKIKERCHEIESSARFVALENVDFLIWLHQVLEALYLKFFEWLTDNKSRLVKKR